MPNFNIPGLASIHGPELKVIQPGIIPEKELESMSNQGGPLRFFESVVDDSSVVDAITAIQAQLQFAAVTGRNPELTGVYDFNMRGVKLGVFNPPGVNYVDPGPYLVIQTKKDKSKYTVVQAYPPSGVSLASFHYATANSLVELDRTEV